MNKQRRKELGSLIDAVSALNHALTEAVASCSFAGENVNLDDLISDLERLKDEEEEFKENMPESLQSGERYEAAEGAVQALESAIGSLGDLKDALEAFNADDVISAIDEARGLG